VIQTVDGEANQKQNNEQQHCLKTKAL